MARPTYDDLIRPLEELIRRFLAGAWSYPEFKRRFQPALDSYASVIQERTQSPGQDRPYSPLDVIADIPEHCASNLREYCEEALDRLPREALDRSTLEWVVSTLIARTDDWTHFWFGGGDGPSRFGDRATFYSTPVDEESFLLSALNGTITRPPFRYEELLTALRDLGGNELASWVYGSEPDNALAVVHFVWSLGPAYEESHMLHHVERDPGEEGGAAYLMLLPKSKRWMLMNEYTGERFSIDLHAPRAFILEFASRIGVEPDWMPRE